MARGNIAVREEDHEDAAPRPRRRRLARSAVRAASAVRAVRAAAAWRGGGVGRGGGGGPFLGLALTEVGANVPRGDARPILLPER